MISKGTKLYSILFYKCPRCHEGQFLETNPYDMTTITKVLDECPKCKQNYKIEPSFYYGSMYVSYAVGIAVAVAVYVLTLLLQLDLSLFGLMMVIVAGLILTAPWINAVSKSIWANIFMHYDAEIAKRVKE